MNLKEIIIEELIFGFKQNKPKWWDYETYLRFIEPIIRGAVNSATSNITMKDDWQVIASGEVICATVNPDTILVGDKTVKEIKYKLEDEVTKHFDENIEIAIRVKEE